MGEFQVSIEGERRDLAAMFFCHRTQKPCGVPWNLPAAGTQMYRFALQWTWV